MTRLVAVAAALALAGCATMGTPVYQENYGKAVIGKSTIQDVRKAWGHPTDLLVSTTGTSELTWEWSESQVKATSFIPFAAYVGGAGTTGVTTKVVARFGKDGVLTDILRGGGTVDITSGTVFQGYETVGEKKATVGDLPNMDVNTLGKRCDARTMCAPPSTCSMVEGKSYGYCVGAPQ